MEKKLIIITCTAGFLLLGAIGAIYFFFAREEPKSMSTEFIKFAEANNLKDYYNVSKNTTISSSYSKFSDELEKLLGSSDTNKLFNGYEKLKTKQDVYAQFKLAYMNAVPKDKINEALLTDLRNYTMFISGSPDINETDDKDLVKFKSDLEKFFKKNDITLKSTELETVFGSKLLSSHLKSLTVSDEFFEIVPKLVDNHLQFLSELKLNGVKLDEIKSFSKCPNLKKIEIQSADNTDFGDYGFDKLESLKVSGKNFDLGKLDKFTNLKELIIDLKGGIYSPEIKDSTSFTSNEHDLEVKVTGTAKPLAFKVPAKKMQN